ncbi:MAG: C4-type zinc ribbon domain-containing protein [Bacteroidaceae bacterium]|nr:C4-type zinc ribbon domain-containing protein [Bacteroidaceae bacterium]
MATKDIKKDPSEYSVEEKLQSLYQLQTMLTEIDKIKTLRGELPLEVQDLEDEIAGLTTRIEKASSDVVEMSKGVTENKNTIEVSKAQIAKYQEQQDHVSNNREFDSLNKEIEFKNLEVELAEKRIREFTNAINAKKEEIETNRAIVAEKQQDLEVKKSELQEIIEENRQEEERLREKCKNLELNIEPRLLQSFKRIRNNTRNGLGIVYVQRESCGGCFNKIPPQRQLDIRMRKKIIVCEYCGRIMIDPELAGVKEESKQTEAPKRRTRKAAAADED